MLEWLKTILGDNYSEEIDTAISGEIGKGFVSKANYDQRNTAYKDLQKQIAERDTQLEELKKVDTAKLQEEIVKLQTTNKTAKEEKPYHWCGKTSPNITIRFVVKSALV